MAAKILITGGSGFIGRNLAEQLRAQYDVLAPSRQELDLHSDTAVRDYLAAHRFDVVIHAATGRSNRKITAAIDTDMPAGVALTTTVAAPSGSGVSAGAKTLSETAQDVVTGISLLNETGIPMSYSLSATSAAGTLTGSRTVTYTILGEDI